ncbi:PREDICTED: uncharacterized protein LOC108781645 [Cyphomyrmex costatus]|uniref:uncharacterized protein LOC108781645 n=1 Tax=Cyphomyrmex costatus TaxID=456900 RepID=UPI00085228C5|nr:PREDICTED: uncharacterized protein LOC108781645 [Cyphomyrmex costatus]
MHNKLEAIALQSELCRLCMPGGFPLRKWAASCRDLLSGIPPEHCLNKDSLSWEHDSHATLGLRWYPAKDEFAFIIRLNTIAMYTKRRVLAETARLFDPLGWLTPVVIQAKILIQSAWLQQIEWDAPLSQTDAQQWQRLFEELPCLEQVRVGRWLGSGDSNSNVELHGFVDASERGYAAVVYLRISTAGDVAIRLLAKSKVAPIKPVSLPRLELSAAALLSNLVTHIRNVLSLSTAPVTRWSDSRVALCWIQGHASRWKTYVANRVSQIQQQLPEARWRHVPGKDNPADCASRGITPTDLISKAGDYGMEGMEHSIPKDFWVWNFHTQNHEESFIRNLGKKLNFN